jgi:Transglutaminase-like superfamily/Domain of Unknown Function with PDB structure (DUF3857)
MKILFSIILLSLFTLLQGQYKEPKFGKIEMSDMTMTRYEKDTSDGALILFDNGESKFVLNNERRFKFEYDRHLRIKIFKKSAFDIADFKLKLYKNGSSKEDLNDLKAATFNLVEGKIVKTKLEKSKIYDEETKYYIVKKIAFPEVKEGSIIEISYSITSDFVYNFRGWTFQYHYPALWSQYYFVLPEYFNYRKSTKGYLPFDINKEEPGYTTFTIHYDAEINAGRNGDRTSAQNYDIKATTTECTLATKDVPAFVSEPNIDCEDNYIQSIEFELASIQYPNEIRQDYTQSWESVNKEMNDDEDFGQLLNSNGFISDTVQNLCKDITSDKEKAIAIYDYVQKRMKWNEDYYLWAPRGLKKPFMERKGNSAEINLLLTLMLKTAGLHAKPVMFSTRDNGIAITFFPTITKFNSVLTKLEIAGEIYLLDATDEYCPMGVLPANDINGDGRVVDDSKGDWVKLETKEKYKEAKSYFLTINQDGKFDGTILGSYDGYAGNIYRTTLSHEKSNDDYVRKLQENTKGLTVSNYSITNRFNKYKPLRDSLNVEISDNADIIGDKILFKPLLFESIEKNKYTLEDRKYPVDYNFPIVENYYFEYTIPQGYQVESLPKTNIIKMPDNSISIIYSITNENNKIKIVYRRTVNKILFLQTEYKELKEMYDQIVKKHAEQIILKKVI